MRKQNIDEILLNETEFYDYKAPHFILLNKHKITTVGELLNEELMRPVYKNVKMDTRRLLNNFIKVVRYKYLGEKLPWSELLDEKLYIRPELFLDFYLNNDEKKRFSLFGFLNMTAADERKILEALNKDVCFKNEIAYGDVRVIDLLKKISLAYIDVIPQYKDLIRSYMALYRNRKSRLKLDIGNAATKRLESANIVLIDSKVNLDALEYKTVENGKTYQKRKNTSLN